MLESGVGHIPEDRHRYGLVLDFTLAENAALHDFRYRPDSRFGWLFPRRPDCPYSAAPQGVRRTRRQSADEGPDALRRKSAEARRRARGGSQPARLIAAQPTRGLDVGAIEYLHRRLVEERDRGRGSSSSRSSSRRPCRSRIASSSCTRARSSRSTRSASARRISGSRCSAADARRRREREHPRPPYFQLPRR